MAKSVWLTWLLMTLVAAGGCKHRSLRSSTATQSEGEGEPRQAGNLQPEFSGALALTMNLEILTLVLPKQAELEDFVSLLVDDNRTDGKGLKFRGLVLTHRDFSRSENRESIELNFKLLSLEKYKEKVRFIKIDTETPLNWSRDWVPLFFRSTDKWFSVEPAYFKNSDEFTIIRNQLAAHLKIPNEQRLLSERRLEGGNIASNGKGTCLVGEGGAAPRSGAAREGVDTFLIPTGCQKVVWLPAINDPEIQIAGTNHIDMWVKLVSEKQVAVAEIDPKLLEDYRSEPKPNQNKYVKAYANTRELSDLASAKRQLDALIEYTQGTLQDGADRLTKAGFEVFRVPVFALNRLNASLNGIQNGRRMILSTSVPSNGNLGRQNPKLWYEVQARAKQIFADQGFWVDAVVDASLFPQESGAFHCSSAHLPWDVVKHLFEQD